MSTYTTRRLAMTAILTLFLGGFIVASTKWAVDMSFSRTKTITTQQFAPEIGNLSLSATLVTENQVILNVTFSGAIGISQPGFVWTVWISNSTVGFETNLHEDLELVEGPLKANGTYPLLNCFLNFQAKLRAIVDGEWTVYGRFSATFGPGLYYGISTGGIRITVSNGSIVQLEKEQCQHQPPSPSGSENQQVSSYH